MNVGSLVGCFVGGLSLVYTLAAWLVHPSAASLVPLSVPGPLLGPRFHGASGAPLLEVFVPLDLGQVVGSFVHCFGLLRCCFRPSARWLHVGSLISFLVVPAFIRPSVVRSRRETSLGSSPGARSPSMVGGESPEWLAELSMQLSGFGDEDGILVREGFGPVVGGEVGEMVCEVVAWCSCWSRVRVGREVGVLAGPRV
jgi:hypothetical protein